MLPATSGHIPLSPAEVVKANTLQKGRSPLSSSRKERTKNFHYKEVLGDPHTEQAFQVFFHEYGRRVGMVPRSSLKEGKNRQMVEKGTKTPKPTQTKHPSPQAETPPSCSLSSTLGETCETETSGN